MAPSAGRLATVFIETDDGARTAFFIYDSQAQLECSLGFATDGTMRCLPRTPLAVSTSSFADATCTMAGGVGGGPACPRFDGVRRAVPNACPAQIAVHTGGAKLDSAYTRAGGQCRPTTAAVYSVGTELVPSTLAEGSSALHPGPGRLRMRMNRSLLGSQRNGLMKDIQLGFDCVAATAADGQTRCLPVDFADAAAGAFGDAGCTARVARRAAGACAATHAGANDLTVCPPVRHIFRLAGRHTGPVYQRGADSVCTQIPAGQDWEYFSVGDEVPPGELAHMVQTLR